MIHHDSSLRYARVPMLLIALFALSLLAMPALADSHAPSTNDANRANGWAHVNVVDDSTPGQITLEFVSTRNFLSCFEYRTDGDTSEQIAEENYNPGATDGLYPFECIANETVTLTLEADEYVEVRMLFGAESDERFEWTRFDVIPVPADAETKDDCKDGGWASYGFANQGQCIRFVNGAGDSR